MNKVLVVDDDPVLTKIYRKHFESAGFSVEVAENAIQGMVVLQEFIPDVVVLDLKMPFRSGADMLASIRRMSRFAKLPIVIVTGEPADSPDVKAIRALGETRILFKSEWNPEATVQAVNAFMSEQG
jgi:DNA-binding response OmpR family regulator